MGDLVLTAGLQDRADLRQDRLAVQTLDLLAVVTVDEGLDPFDGGEDRVAAEQRRQRAGCEPGDPPDRQQPAVRLDRQQVLHQREMPRLRLQMPRREGAHLLVPADGQDSAVDQNGAGLAGVIAAQLFDEPLWESSRPATAGRVLGLP
eukprot:g674.t1